MTLPIFSIFRLASRLSFLITVAVIVILVGGGSAYAAHSNALPGSILYPFKQLWENGQMLLSFSPESKAQTQINIAQDRIKAAQAVVSQTPAATNGSNALPALQQAQQQLQKALENTSKISDPTKRKEIEKNISDTATEAEKEAETETSSASSSDKQDLQQTSDQIKQLQNQAESGD